MIKLIIKTLIYTSIDSLIFMSAMWCVFGMDPSWKLFYGGWLIKVYLKEWKS